MSKRIKYKNEILLDSSGIVHNKKLLSEILNSINIMTATLTNDYSLSNTSQWQIYKLNLKKYSSFGEKLTISNGGIKIGPNISYIKINANVNFNSSDNIGDVMIYKNNSSINYTRSAPKSQSRSTSTSNILIDVAEGDIIYLYIYSDTASKTINVSGNSSRADTYLTVEAIG